MLFRSDIIVTIGPVDEDFTQGGLQFIDEVKGGNVPKEFIPSVQKGFQQGQRQPFLGVAQFFLFTQAGEVGHCRRPLGCGG